MTFVVTIREGPEVSRERFDEFDLALTYMEGALRPIAARTDRPTAQAFVREIAPERQVVARGEVSGPGRLRAGVDVRGDGSTEAFTGRLRRTPIDQQDGEDAFQSLRRVIGERS